MIETRCATLEEGGDDDDPEILGERLQKLARGAGNRLGEIKIFVVFDLAKIDGKKELLEADDIGALRGGLADASYCRCEVGLPVDRTGILDESDFNLRAEHK